MKRALDLLNALGFALALALAMVGGGTRGALHPRPGAPRRPPGAALSPQPERLANGELALRDARAELVPLARYRRIASGTLVSDRVLADLCEPARIVAFTRYAQRGANAQRYAGKPAISARDDVERVLALKPDLVLVSELVDLSYLARLREHGVRVFDLGPMRGLETVLPNIRAIGALIGHPAQAEQYASALARRMARVAERVPASARPRALYLSVYGDRLFGAGHHTSYHDLLEHAGLRDAAAEHGLSDWPELSGERALAIDPELLVTRAGMGARVCRHPGLERLRPCRGAGRIVELDGALLDDPGPALLDATEALYEAYWTR